MNDENYFKAYPTNYPYISDHQCLSKCSTFYKEENGIKTWINIWEDYVINETGGHIKKLLNIALKEKMEI